jgi:hypothetical protein
MGHLIDDHQGNELGAADSIPPGQSRSGPVWSGRLRRSRPLAIVVATVALAIGVAVALAVRGPGLTTRDRDWQRDVAYLARELPAVHVGGLTSTSKAAWLAAAARLEAQVPHLSDGQIIVGLARMVAMLHDDETQLILPQSRALPFAATWIGSRLYLTILPAADRGLLGAQLVAVNGHPIGVVMARLGAVIDQQDPGLARAAEVDFGGIDSQFPSYLNNPNLLVWLGLARTPDRATLTVQTPAGRVQTATLPSLANRKGAKPPPWSELPQALYQQDSSAPYWLKVLPVQHAVYLKYNQCLDDDGFQRLSAEAVGVLRVHPGYRLIVDLRDNPGGDSDPFLALIADIRAAAAVNRHGRVIGLVNGLTDSSATVDAYNLSQQTNAVLMGQQVADPIDEYGNNDGELRLPYHGLLVQYTTLVVNPQLTRYGSPNIVVAPTLDDLLTGTDPVLAAALSYRG